MNFPIDRQVLLRLRDGDESAFEILYNEFSAKVYQMAFRFLKEAPASEEIVQETFLKFWLNRQQIDCDGNTWLYLYVIAKRLCLNQLRAIAQSAVLSEKLLRDVSEFNNSTEESVIAADLERYANTVIATLPSRQQLIFKMSRLDGLSHKEISEKLGISQNTVKNHMVQALKTIKLQLINV